MSNDGIDINAKGYQVWAGTMQALLQETLGRKK
jgi:lysophospholipase L1-like esterase